MPSEMFKMWHMSAKAKNVTNDNEKVKNSVRNVENYVESYRKY